MSPKGTFGAKSVPRKHSRPWEVSWWFRRGSERDGWKKEWGSSEIFEQTSSLLRWPDTSRGILSTIENNETVLEVKDDIWEQERLKIHYRDKRVLWGVRMSLSNQMIAGEGCCEWETEGVSGQNAKLKNAFCQCADVLRGQVTEWRHVRRWWIRQERSAVQRRPEEWFCLNKRDTKRDTELKGCRGAWG